MSMAPAEQALYEPSEANATFCAKRETSTNRGTRAGEIRSFIFFFSPLSRASRKILRSPRLAHKATVHLVFNQRVSKNFLV